MDINKGEGWASLGSWAFSVGQDAQKVVGNVACGLGERSVWQYDNDGVYIESESMRVSESSRVSVQY